MVKTFRTIRSYLLARFYDRAMAGVEKRCLGVWRHELLHRAQGDLLEIGAGTGLNLQYYPLERLRVWLSEPDRLMRRQLARKTANLPDGRIQLKPWPAETIAMPDASFDTIVSTLVLCSVDDLAASLEEIFRLLRPGGRLLFLEHIIAEQPRLRRWQQRIEPFWSCCAGNCRLTRDTAAAICAAGLEMEQLTEAPLCGAPAFVNRTIRGSARKP
jgi:ubiquinone/menaquinone biosynthesis C-methylase UbiE